jgi:trehalose utilization protein
MIEVVVWGENVHDREDPHVRAVYPETMHECVASAVRAGGQASVRTATLDQPEHGLTEALLAKTDVLTWWGTRPTSSCMTTSSSASSVA